MLAPFFVLAAQSPTRQRAFQQLVGAHLGLMLIAVWATDHLARLEKSGAGPAWGHLLLIAGIVEGAVLIGWRLTQLPKSQALEFLLVCQVPPWRIYGAEALVGLSRLALVTLSGLPALVYLILTNKLLPDDLVLLLVMPFTWGAITGLGLTTWAYEPVAVRRWGERLVLALIIFYLAVGVLAAEQLPRWLGGAEQAPWQLLFLEAFRGFHLYNPFGVTQYWLENYGKSSGENAWAWQQLLWLELFATCVLAVLLGRSAARFKEHFHDRHYRPILDDDRATVGVMGDRPLSWWAVRRVMEYSGRVNLWLAGGFSILYACYTVGVAAQVWPDWMGRQVFIIVDRAGGIPVLAAGLMVLSAVPAAFQYGLWDSNAHDRCRRLELLLLTSLDARDYWEAAASAAWRRGRGYFGVAVILWSAVILAQPPDLRAIAGAVLQVAMALTAGLLLWGLYFAVGFRAFSRGLHANNLGMLLTVGLPGLTIALFKAGEPGWAMLLPPGSVYGPFTDQPVGLWLPGPILAALLTAFLTRFAFQRCDFELRSWYDLHHGRKVLD